MESLLLIVSKRKFFAPAWVFASLNIVTGTWVLYLPYIKNKFGLNDAEIGIALFCMAFGLLLSMPFIPLVNRTIGVGKSTILGISLFAIAFNTPFLASSFSMLCICLFIIGVFTGYTDVSMNALVSTIEITSDKSFMSAAHGFFSLGGFVGAGIGSFLLNIYSSPLWHMVTISGFILLINVILSKHYISRVENRDIEESAEGLWQNLRPLLGLSAIAFIIMVHEGAVEHWSNLFLFDVVRLSESKAGMGFVAFSLCMTIGRFFGDGLSRKFGALQIIMSGCLVALVAYFLILTATSFQSILGFGLLGLGLSVIIPELFRMAGKAEGVVASVGISIVSGVGFIGFLIGPVVLGLISNWSSLISSFVFLTFLMFVVILLLLFRAFRK